MKFVNYNKIKISLKKIVENNILKKNSIKIKIEK